MPWTVAIVLPEKVTLLDGPELNASFPMLVTLFGIVTLVSPMQPENACSQMFVTLFGIVTLVRFMHPANAEFPMLPTPSGIVTLYKLLQL